MVFSRFHTLTVNVVNQSWRRLKTEAPVYWETLKKNKTEALVNKLTDINKWYTKLLHLDEVKLYQERVVTLQERLLEAQDRRREASRLLAETRKKSNQLQDEIHKVKRQENIERFLQLMKEETEVLRTEHEISRTFQECDQTERELFSAFTNAVRDSHERQRAQLEYTKYFGIILSIIGSFLAFCYTTIRKNDLKKAIEDSLAKNMTVMRFGLQNSNKNDSNLDNLVTVLKNDTAKLKEVLNFSHNQAVYLKQENENMKNIIFYTGVGVLLLLLFKGMSN